MRAATEAKAPVQSNLAVDADAEAEPTKDRANRGYHGVVVSRGPNNEPITGFITARTKRDLVKQLADPGIVKVAGIIRGTRLEFGEARKVSF